MSARKQSGNTNRAKNKKKAQQRRRVSILACSKPIEDDTVLRDKPYLPDQIIGKDNIDRAVKAVLNIPYTLASPAQFKKYPGLSIITWSHFGWRECRIIPTQNAGQEQHLDDPNYQEDYNPKAWKRSVTTRDIAIHQRESFQNTEVAGSSVDKIEDEGELLTIDQSAAILGVDSSEIQAKFEVIDGKVSYETILSAWEIKQKNK